MSNVAYTHRQEREAGDVANWYETYRRIKTLKSKRSLWRLRQDKPELFAHQAQQEALVSEQESLPLGFRPCEREGWLYHPDKKAYLEKSTRRLYWLDASTSTYQDLYEGDSMPVVFASGAATVQDVCKEPSQGGAAGASSGPRRGSAQAAAGGPSHGLKHVAIPDLHRAAEALKVDLDHLDRPAAMLAVFGPAGDAASAEAAACGLHMKLLRRLGVFRGEWLDSTLQGALAGALDDLAADHGGCRPNASVVLSVGERVVTAATPGAQFQVATRLCSPMPPSPAPAVSSSAALVEGRAVPQLALPALSEPTAVATHALSLVGDPQELHVHLVTGSAPKAAAGVGEISSEVVARHLLRGRPRAASVALLRCLRQGGAQGSLAAACARLAPAGADARQVGADVRPAGAAKRPRLVESVGKVRVRQILLRHTGTPRPMDPVRKRPVRRSLEDAELEMLDMICRLEADGCAGFAATCRAVSECQSALKGGELAGDLGWLDCSVARGAEAQQEKGKAAVRPQVPAPVLKAAPAL
eukprot:CAMPEP_0168456562 /NCGR_PEP_ID=MMETSP0228-20121227/51358_1 /TAXON_ID=133427 /ORGANISM="Protoceratium reticulatum, Strain CCCM 535 (=CCMP 1889)" /LENGTH=527 /DNA_ID=CAMNT_0008471499 /DNA_START=47 /DNA_END=1626 /DNA_ORIENTATION=+